MGFLFLVLYPSPPSSSSRRLPSSHIQLVITQLTHNSTHTQLAHTQLNSRNLLTHNSAHTQLAHTHTTQLTHNLSSHNLLTHNLPYSYITHTHTHVSSHNLSTHNLFTHNFLTQNLSTHNLLTHNLSFLTSTFVTGVALGDIHLRFTWQAWHLVTSTFVSRGRRGTYGTGRALVAHRVLS